MKPEISASDQTDFSARASGLTGRKRFVQQILVAGRVEGKLDNLRALGQLRRHTSGNAAQTVLFFKLFLCLPRACLGKYSVLV